ncbi:TraY domain-containing protein [Photobacterium damselae subsp. damselae]|uniref:TraY domain-containing protein n=1 Tax=Photobacterium damselae TaxID=38293 RepID=UPI0010FE17D3|nr:TraY domain-containing protein [Photobacterium damselae]MBA5685072.1 TraY domain-containing protein [Photobacterium damselae subsp. damselae]TLS66833.1 TraY domain-containing protein [Photobacterium damselae subsp. damselae]
MISKSDSKQKAVYVTVLLSADSNELIKDSARRSKRSKKQEVELRLEDHIKRFASITEIGSATLR